MLTKTDRLIKAAVETSYLEGRTLEDAQILALTALSRIAASTGPKNLQRLVAENSSLLTAGVAEKDFEVPDFRADCESYVPVPARLLQAAFSYLIMREGEERWIARELHGCLNPEVLPK